MNFWKSRKMKLDTFLILVSTSSVLFLLFIVSIFLYTVTVREIENRIENINRIKFNQVAADIDGELDQLDKLAEYIKNNQRLMNYIEEIESKPTDAYTSHKISVKISNLLFNIKEYMDSIKSINVITDKAQYNGGNILFNYHLLQKYSSSRTDTISIISPQTLHPRDGQDLHYKTTADMLDDHYYFSFSLSNGEKHYGNVYIILNDILSKSRFANYNNIILVDNNKNILWNRQKNPNFNSKTLVDRINLEDEGEVFYNDLNSKIYAKRLAFKNWHVIFVSEKEIMSTQLKLLRNLVITAFVLSLSIGLIFSKSISRKILYPVTKLMRLMRNYTDNTVSGNITKKKNRFSLREKLFLYFMLSILIPVLLFTIIYYYQSNKIIKEQVINSYHTLFEKAVFNVNEYISRKQMIIQRIVFDSSVVDYVRFHETMKDKGMDVILEIFEENKFLGLDRDVISIFNLKDNKLLISNRLDHQEYLNEDYYANVLNTNSRMIWSLNNDELNMPMISLGMNFGLLHDIGESSYINLDIDSLYLAEIYSELKSENGEAFIVNEHNKIFSHLIIKNIGKDQDHAYYGMTSIEKVSISGEDFLVFAQKLDNAPLYFIFKYKYKDLVQQSSVTLTENAYIFIILVLVIIILAFMVTFIILKPINALNRQYMEFDPTDSDSTYSNQYFIEDIDILESSFNQMIERIEKLIDELIISNIKRSKLESEKKDAEIKSLQAQINPHFLYNTLDSINYMIKKNQRDKSLMMVNALSDLFRYGISRKELLIRVDEEIKYAKAYAEIMNSRYDNEIQFKWNIDDNILKQKVIKLILQPVIENAIYHGVSGNKGEKIIIISSIKEENNLVFEVEDNGKGMSEDELKLIMDNLVLNDETEHMGIYNVQSRINLYYAKEYGVSVQSSQGAGTVVKIRIPMMED